MSEYIEDMKFLEEARKKEKATLRNAAPDELYKAGIMFEIKNNGAHIVLEGKDGYIDFWPGTGKWADRTGDKVKGFGITNLIKHVQGG